MNKKITIPKLQKMKENAEKIVMVTAYDFPSASACARANVEVILVGDSLGMTVLGYDNTIPVKIEDMVYHTKIVNRAKGNAMVVADLPFGTYTDEKMALKNSLLLMQEAGADAVKIEGSSPEIINTVKTLTKNGIPVVGHIGLTPQMAAKWGGFFVQGKSKRQAKELLDAAMNLANAGAFSIVLECIPYQLAADITKNISIATIGIGAGPDCDGQVLVYNDLIGMDPNFKPKFVKNYATVHQEIHQALTDYGKDVKEGAFPTLEHSFIGEDEKTKDQDQKTKDQDQDKNKKAK